jgi:hypothetical protein
MFGSVLRKVLGLLALVVALAGFVTIVVNPMQWIAPLLPIHLTTILGPVHINRAYIQGLLTTLHTDQMVQGIALGVFSLLVLVGGILLVQSPIYAIKSLGRAIKASPMAVLRSPLTAYRRLIVGRNWLLAKIEYLNAESAKWKTTFNIFKSPFSLLRAAGFSPQMAAGLLFAGTAVSTGVVINETVLSERSFRNGDAGVYLAPSDVPVSYVSDPKLEGFNTLRVDLGSTPVRELTVSNVSLNRHTGSALPSGQQNVIEVGGNAASSGFTATRLHVGVLVFENNRCKSLELSDTQTHLLVIAGNSSDGMSISPTAASGAANRRMAIGGGNHSAEAMQHSGGLFDRLWISSNTSGVHGSVDKLTLQNISSKGGPCKLSRINASEIHILLNTIGHDSNLSTKEFVVSTNVTASVIIVEDNIEMNVSEPATQ